MNIVILKPKVAITKLNFCIYTVYIRVFMTGNDVFSTKMYSTLS